MKWLRLYTEVLDDPKVQRLPAPLFKTWVNLLCLCGKGDGRLPSAADIAFALRIDEAAAREAIGALTARGLLEVVDGALVPHNWHGRQFRSDNVTERVKRFRERGADVSRNAADQFRETPPDTDTDTDTDTEQIRSRAPAREGGAVAPGKNDMNRVQDEGTAHETPWRRAPTRSQSNGARPQPTRRERDEARNRDINAKWAAIAAERSHDHGPPVLPDV